VNVLGKIPKRGKPMYLKPEDVENDDLATILDPPIILDAEDSKFKKERTVITIVLTRNKNIYRWGLNNTSNDRLVDAFGEEGNLWVKKTVKIQKRLEHVSGKERPVLYAVPQTTATQEELSVST
jgi:hypothetical protein